MYAVWNELCFLISFFVVMCNLIDTAHTRSQMLHRHAGEIVKIYKYLDSENQLTIHVNLELAHFEKTNATCGVRISKTGTE